MSPTRFDAVYDIAIWFEHAWWALIIAALIGMAIGVLVVAGSLWFASRGKTP